MFLKTDFPIINHRVGNGGERKGNRGNVAWQNRLLFVSQNLHFVQFHFLAGEFLDAGLNLEQGVPDILVVVAFFYDFSKINARLVE